MTKRLVHNIIFNSFLFDWRVQNDVNYFYLQKYSRDLHPFPVLNEADKLIWPYMLERLSCQSIPGQRWPGSRHGTPDVNSGTVPGVPGRLATLPFGHPIVDDLI